MAQGWYKEKEAHKLAGMGIPTHSTVKGTPTKHFLVNGILQKDLKWLNSEQITPVRAKLAYSYLSGSPKIYGEIKYVPKDNVIEVYHTKNNQKIGNFQYVGKYKWKWVKA